MKTLYIDIYFLLNFTVDLISLYISVRTLHMASTTYRLLFGAALGGSIAVFCIYSASLVWSGILSIVWLFLIAWIIPKHASFLRRFRFSILFLLYELLVGGVTYYGYNLFIKTKINEYFKEKNTAESKNMILISAVVLLCIGVVRLWKGILFDASAKGKCLLTVSFGGKEESVEGLLDSGNLLKEPFSGLPVVLCKHGGKISTLFSTVSTDSVPMAYRLRLVPVNFGGTKRILTAYCPSHVYIGRKKQEITAWIAWDTQEGSYDGMEALIPAAVWNYEMD